MQNESLDRVIDKSCAFWQSYIEQKVHKDHLYIKIAALAALLYEHMNDYEQEKSQAKEEGCVLNGLSKPNVIGHWGSADLQALRQLLVEPMLSDQFDQNNQSNQSDKAHVKPLLKVLSEKYKLIDWSENSFYFKNTGVSGASKRKSELTIDAVAWVDTCLNGQLDYQIETYKCKDGKWVLVDEYINIRITGNKVSWSLHDWDEDLQQFYKLKGKSQLEALMKANCLDNQVIESYVEHEKKMGFNQALQLEAVEFGDIESVAHHEHLISCIKLKPSSTEHLDIKQSIERLTNGYLDTVRNQWDIKTNIWACWEALGEPKQAWLLAKPKRLGRWIQVLTEKENYKSQEVKALENLMNPKLSPNTMATALDALGHSNETSAEEYFNQLKEACHPLHNFYSYVALRRQIKDSKIESQVPKVQL